ncbi:DUF4168 domain-containing protein [Marivita sp.]|uniref:DUF4168 domain-containing protein n=1 Tax=Marivita sp. TaxID=2003365 RepID=UPI0025BFFD4D|nr:DUF4168 domain-containing protein [Marivita sp.]
MTLTTTTTLSKAPRAIALAAATAAFGLFATAPVIAQTTTPAPEAVETDFSDAKLDAFVTALQDVDAVRQTYIPQIEATGDPEEQQDLVDEANTAITDTIEGTPDISVDEYVTIAQLAQQDPELNQRIVDRVELAN